jgi:probable F420-dependent oxidoreductase
VAADLEELGVDILMNWDHFFSQYGSNDDRHFECWTMLGAWAEATSRVEIGPLVSCSAYRNADLVADMARTLDHISGGRFILGIGSGWCERDFTEYRYDFGTTKTRIDTLADSLGRIERRLGLLNPPALRKIPILVGGNGARRTLRLAAAYADIWHGLGDPAKLRELNQKLDAWCAEVARDRGEIERATRVFRKTPDSVGKDFVDCGIRLFTLVVQGPLFDLGHVADWLAFRDDYNVSHDPMRAGPLPRSVLSGRRKGQGGDGRAPCQDRHSEA